MTTHTDMQWAIAGLWSNGNPFLYTGTYLTRKAAIIAFIHNRGTRADYDSFRSEKDPAYRRRIWAKCRYRGDHAVKVIITYEYPS